MKRLVLLICITLILCVLPLVDLELRRFLEPPLCLIESASLSTSARFILS